MKNYILAIDQGTTSTRVVLLDKQARFVYQASKEHKQIYPKSSWVEHNPQEIWNNLIELLACLIKDSKIDPKEIASIGITNQRETSVIWNKKTGQPVYNAIVWQCRRTIDFCSKIKLEGKEALIKEKTGLVVDPYFSASKWKWILENDLSLNKDDLLAGTMDTFLISKLTGHKVHATDVSNASRTQLMNINTLNWDEELLKIFSVPSEILPQIKSSNEIFGYTKGLDVLPDGISISGVAGDQQAALFGQACFEEGTAKCTFGTGSFILINTGSQKIESQHKLLTTVAWKLKDQPVCYALEGGAFMCGAIVQWLRDNLRIILESSDIEALALEVEETGGVQLVPAFAGLGAPYWNPKARALLCGMTRGTGRAHIARAGLEAMAWQNVEILLAMQKDYKGELKNLRVDGGAIENNLLMQIQSDFLGKKLIRPQNKETTVMGAAFLAGLSVGFWSSLQEIKKLSSVDQEFLPSLSEEQRLKRFALWQEAVKKTF